MRRALSVVVLISFMMISCGPKPPAQQGYYDAIPREMREIIDRKYQESIFAIGTAQARDEALAVNKATLQARAEIARVFKTRIDVLQKSYEETVNDRSGNEYSQVMQNFAGIQLSGSHIAKTLLLREAGGHLTAKTLVVVSAESFKQVVDEKMNAFTSFKASKAYKELEERVQRERELARDEEQSDY